MPQFVVPPVVTAVLIAGLTALAGCSLNAAHLVYETPTSLAARPSGSELRVMSANVRRDMVLDTINAWPLRKNLLVQTIRRFDPDILGTQEALAHQTDFLRVELSDYGYVGVGRGDGEQSGEMCGIFFRASMFSPADSGHFWLSDAPDQPGSAAWGAWFPRMVSWVKLDPADPAHEPLYVFNTHFSAFSDEARLNSARLMQRRIEQIAGHAPVIVTGDFNAQEDSQTYAVMLGGEQGRALIDTYREARPRRGADEKTIHGFHGGALGSRIDWIVVSEQFATRAAGIDRSRAGAVYPSDHYPVTAVLDWRPAALAAVEPTEAPAAAN